MDLPRVQVEGYSLKIFEGGGLLGDKADHHALQEIKAMSRNDGDDAAGDQMDRTNDDEVARRFASQLAEVITGFSKHPSWQAVERVAVGGGIKDSRLGTRIVSHAQAFLDDGNTALKLAPLHHSSDDGALLGWASATPCAVSGPHYLAVDIGGTNVRCGVVSSAGDQGAPPTVSLREKWNHSEAEARKGELMSWIADTLCNLKSRSDIVGGDDPLFIGIACPGIVSADGRIESGAHNLPGEWHDEGFNLPREMKARLAERGLANVKLMLHNDAVVQGLSELPFMSDHVGWAVVTLGTGFGNASYRNKPYRTRRADPAVP